MDTNTFKQTIYALSQQIGAQILQILPLEVTPNFIAAALKFKQQIIYVLCSENQDWAFFQQPQPFKLKFFDMPDLAKTLHNLTNIQVYSTTNSTPPSKYNHSFNWWD